MRNLINHESTIAGICSIILLSSYGISYGISSGVSRGRTFAHLLSNDARTTRTSTASFAAGSPSRTRENRIYESGTGLASEARLFSQLTALAAE